MKSTIYVCVIMLLFFIPAASAEVFHVGGTTIQNTINIAADGDTIYVHPGIYIENVIVDKSVILLGCGSGVTLIQAAHSSRPCFLIRANDVRLSGFGVSGAMNRSVGVHLSSSHNTTIEDNTFINNYANVYIEYTNNSIIQNNILLLAEWKAIGVYNRCNNTKIIGNTVTHSNGSGIFLKYRVNNTLIANNIVEHINGMGAIYSFTRCYNTTISGNTVKNNICKYGGIFVSIGDNHTIVDNVVTGNVIEHYGGITLYSTSGGHLVTRNVLTNNTKADLHVRFAQGCLIYDNHIEKTAYIYYTLYDTSNPNRWNITPMLGTNIIGGPLIGGNFWGNYTAPDSNYDGIGNVPFALPRVPNATDYDYHPLVHNTAVECGDVDCNNYISANDAVEAYWKAVNPEHIIGSEWAADVDNNGYISANDVTSIYRKAINPAHPLHCDTS